MEQSQAVPAVPCLRCEQTKCCLKSLHFGMVNYTPIDGWEQKYSTSDIFIDCFYLREAMGPLCTASNPLGDT